MSEDEDLARFPREYNIIIKDIRSVDVLFGYCYPSTYRAGMTSLAMHLFYSVLNSREDTSCERYFRFDVPSPVRSVDSGRPLRDNHIIGFSLTYEEDIVNLIHMLDQGNIPIRAEERGTDSPLVIVGGPSVSANPEPYVDFVDVFVIGDGDLVIHEIVDIARDSESRYAALDSLAEVEGLYVPSRQQDNVARLVVDDLNALFHPTSQIVPDVPDGSVLEPVFGKSLLVEVARGCGHACKFCLVGHVCRPRRVRTLTRLKSIIEEGLTNTPAKKVSLIASSPGDMDQLEDLVHWIVGKGLEVSVPSLRADDVTEGLLASLVKGGQRTLTIAPETGSESLRRTTGKGLRDSDIETAVQIASAAGYRAIKLYYIVGLPGETEDDIKAIAHMTKRIAEISNLRVTANVNPFIPKAHTKWQRNAQPSLEQLRKKLKNIDNELRNARKIQFEALDPRRARIQAALSLGDRSLGRVIERAAQYSGLSGWRRAEKETGVPFFAVANDSERLKGNLPWAFINL